jgi:hypothetical protein
MPGQTPRACLAAFTSFIIFNDFSAISPQWPLDRVSPDIFVTA